MTFIHIILFLLFMDLRLAAEKKPKKDIRDYSDRDLENLYDQWEENDEDELEEDELPSYKRPPKTHDIDELLKQAKSPEEILKLTKKGQSVMMFVNVANADGTPASKDDTEKWTSLWQSSLYNNHIDVQRFVIEDSRVIYMFSDGSKAWEAKDYFLEQKQVSELTLEGKQYDGPAKKNGRKTEL